MKRTFAVVVLLAALGMFLKLALREDRHPAVAPIGPVEATSAAAAVVDPEVGLLARHPADKDLVRRVYAEFRQNALAIERTDGLRGLKLLDALGVEAIYLYESHPGDFGRLREALTDASAAEILLRWREYFGLKRADDTDRKVVISEIARLTPSQRRVAAKYPNALPLLLTDPVGVTELVTRWSGDPADLADSLALLSFISLESGAADSGRRSGPSTTMSRSPSTPSGSRARRLRAREALWAGPGRPRPVAAARQVADPAPGQCLLY